MHLSPDSLAKIDHAVAKYPPDQKQSAVMAALTIAQDEKGWLSTETMDFVAAYLGMPPVAVYEVATFYTMYDLKPVGRNKLAICTNLPCALQGATAAADHLKRKLGIGFGVAPCLVGPFGERQVLELGIAQPPTAIFGQVEEPSLRSEEHTSEL